METRIIVAGGRHFSNYQLILECLDAYITEHGSDVCIVSGHALGVDSLGERYAKEHNLPCKIFPANWDLYGRAAGPIRNQQMIDFAREEYPVLMAFWNGRSPGTRDMINKANKFNAEVHIITVEDEA